MESRNAFRCIYCKPSHFALLCLSFFSRTYIMCSPSDKFRSLLSTYPTRYCDSFETTTGKPLALVLFKNDSAMENYSVFRNLSGTYHSKAKWEWVTVTATCRLDPFRFPYSAHSAQDFEASALKL